MDRPNAFVLAGPNGAGKSTLYHRYLRPMAERHGVEMGPWLNADEYARAQWGPGHDLAHAYDAAREMARQRDELIARRVSFTTETVFSHPSKLELLDTLNSNGYDIWLEIVAVPVETSIERVAQRVAEGGHDVPEDKIRQRAERTDALLAKAITRVHQARIWTNDRNLDSEQLNADVGHRRHVRLERGRVMVRYRSPDWFGPHLRDAIDRAPRGPDPERQRAAGAARKGLESPQQWSVPRVHRPPERGLGR